MTREEILAMKPGRELDARVARAVGWTDVSYQLGGRYLNPKDEWPVEYEGWFGKPPRWNGSADDLLPEVPYYSTEIAAAWELVDELHARGMWLSINTLTNVIHVNADSDRPYLRSVTSRPMRLVALSVGESVPHSICLAFLLAMEEQPMG